MAAISRDALARALLELHLLGGSAARGELTDRVGCTRSVMGFLLREMTERGLVIVDRSPSGVRRPDGGRPSHQVRVSDQAPVAIAAALSADTVRAATVALGGNVLRREEHSLPAGRAIPDVVDDLCSMVADQARAVSRLLGIGVAVPSPVRREDGYVFAALHLGWPGIALRELMLRRLSERLGMHDLRLTVANDANAAALAESRRGAGRDARQLLYLMTSRVGLGGALISEQEVFAGAHGYAIEPGHVMVNPNGAACLCGSHGCLEVEADHRALLRAAGEQAESTEEMVERVGALLARARGDEKTASAALRTVGGALGTGLASLINLTDPDCIVLGDTLGTVFELQPDPIIERAAAGAFLNPAGEIPIRPGALDDAALIGAAELAFQPLLVDPRSVVAKG
jgi:predicted NBD/HSP70 family sugar kinase